MLPRRFALVRHVDYTGVSGIGVVAFGIAFSDGHVVLRWCSAHPATSTWNSLEDMLAVHGHGEATNIQWIDAPVSDLEDLPAAPGRGRRAHRRAAGPERASAPAAAAAVPDTASNGFPRPLDAADATADIASPPVTNATDPLTDTVPSGSVVAGHPVGPQPRPPGRHRRADQVEPSV